MKSTALKEEEEKGENEEEVGEEDMEGPLLIMPHKVCTVDVRDWRKSWAN